MTTFPAVALVILDGWGLAPPGEGNAIDRADTPVFDELWSSFPHTQLVACGRAVGLPEGQMGNSEVGHLNLGAGAVVKQDLTRIDESLVEKRELNDVLDAAMTDVERLHLVGLVSDGGVHSSLEHLEALVSLARDKGIPDVVILGGFQEPGHGAAASLLGLLLDDEQKAMVLADPEKAIPAAVHEGLRWIAPFGLHERQARVDIELHGVTIPAGAELALACASANHDERRYEHGERFDITRQRQSHASFGYGAHFCSGHFISRRLEQIILEETFAGLPGLRLDPDREPVVFGFAVRGVKNLPVVWDA